MPIEKQWGNKDETMKQRAREILEAADGKQMFHILYALYQRQTASERAHATAKVCNGRGFTSHDAQTLTSVAKQSEQYRSLTYRQTEWMRKCLLKYWRQVLEIEVELGQMPKSDDAYSRKALTPSNP